MLLTIRGNQVRRAVELLGGPTKAAHATGVSNTTIHSWVKQGVIKNIDKAKLVSKLTKIDVNELRRMA